MHAAWLLGWGLRPSQRLYILRCSNTSLPGATSWISNLVSESFSTAYQLTSTPVKPQYQTFPEYSNISSPSSPGSSTALLCYVSAIIDVHIYTSTFDFPVPNEAKCNSHLTQLLTTEYLDACAVKNAYRRQQNRRIFYVSVQFLINNWLELLKLPWRRISKNIHTDL